MNDRIIDTPHSQEKEGVDLLTVNEVVDALSKRGFERASNDIQELYWVMKNGFAFEGIHDDIQSLQSIDFDPSRKPYTETVTDAVNNLLAALKVDYTTTVDQEIASTVPKLLFREGLFVADGKPVLSLEARWPSKDEAVAVWNGEHEGTFKDVRIDSGALHALEREAVAKYRRGFGL